MLDQNEILKARKRAIKYLTKAGIIITKQEHDKIEVADFGLGKLEETGLQILTYVNTERCCAKELILFPGQTCPEHRHPPVSGEPGKEETFRCRWGKVFLYMGGIPVGSPQAIPPKGKEDTYTVWHEINLAPGEQVTLQPDTKHWFQAGKSGAVVSEFSTRSRDESDIFTDAKIKRTP